MSFLCFKFLFEKRNNLHGEGHFSTNPTSLEKIPGMLFTCQVSVDVTRFQLQAGMERCNCCILVLQSEPSAGGFVRAPLFSVFPQCAGSSMLVLRCGSLYLGV